MANSPQAIKRARQNIKHRLTNASQRTAMRTSIKKTLAAIHAGNKETAQSCLKQAVVLLDRYAGKHLIHANRAARLKSRLNKKLKAMSA